MSIARHHAEWLSLVEASGPFLSLQVLLDAFPQGIEAHEPEHFRTLRQAYEEWQDTSSDIAIHRAWVEWVLKQTLEFPDEVLLSGQQIPTGLQVSIAVHHETLRPNWIIVNPSGTPEAEQPRLLVNIVPPDQHLEKPLKTSRWKASPAMRMMELLHGCNVRLGLITNGEQWMLVNAPKGETTGYISWYSNLWLEEKLTIRAFRSLLGVRRFFGVDDDQTLESLLAQSANSQQEVTDQLGYQVRAAVEVLVQALDRIDTDRNRSLLQNISDAQLYEAALTVMMRLVFLFSAEERGLLLLGDALYDQNYAVSTLRAQLRETADKFGEEILERRYDAWCRLLATFRAVYGGIEHDVLRLPAYGGKLFDPDRFGFLEGRIQEGWRNIPANPIPVNNRTVLHLLEALQILQVKVPGGGAESRRLSFRALDIEQIGHVYEGLLDRTAVRATAPVLGLIGSKDKNPEVALEVLERELEKGEDKLIEFLKKETGRSESALLKALLGDNRESLSLRGTKQSQPSLSPDGTQQSLSLRGTKQSQPSLSPDGTQQSLSLRGTKQSQPSLSPDGTQPSLSLRGTKQSQPSLSPDGTQPSLSLRGTKQSPSQEEARFLVACNNDRSLWQRVRPFMGLIRKDTFDYPVIIPQGSVYVTQGTHRRETGTHYTPKSLTEEIVRYTLESRVYVGVAEGKPKTDWQLKSAAELLQLKICDMAMGSGAFLVQVCRYLATRLVEAWESAERANPGKVVVAPEGTLSKSRPTECIIPKEADERLLVAKRIVAERCIYGVDKNPLAVEMAKLSLWLETLQKDKPFTFVDHALKCGDSLVGVTLEQLRGWNLDVSEGVQLDIGSDRIRHEVNEAIELRLKIESAPVSTPQDRIQKEYLLVQANARIKDLRDRSDLLVSSYLAEGSKSEQDALRQRLLLVARGNSSVSESDRAILPDLEKLRPFHWELEFPEVFLTASLGFDALVGNPPFMGGKKITGALGTSYRDYLVEWIAKGKRGSADLCAYFFLRGQQLITKGGGFGLVATNTIAQGDTREVGLDQLVAAGGVINRAVPSRRWEGTASLEVAYVWLHQGKWSGEFVLDEKPVSGITPFLTVPGKVAGNPYRLVANQDKSFIGSIVLGMGFVLTPEEAQALIEKDPRNKDILFPYLNGEDLNSRPDQSPSRWVINFKDWALDAEHDDPKKPKGHPYAADYPDCLAIVEEKVKPEREKNNRKVYRDCWWHYGEKQTALYKAIADMKQVIVVAATSRTLAFAYVPSKTVFSHATNVFTLKTLIYFALLQSVLHEAWVREYASSMKEDLRYTPTDCFLTFPFPSSTTNLEQIGERYHTHRQNIMLSQQEGLTKTYNRFHNPESTDSDIETLRQLHVEMDSAVAAAYGWHNINLDHNFHSTKQGLRYTISETARREVLDRLLQLNHSRYAEEVAQGLHDKGKKKGKATGKKSKTQTSPEQPRLF